MSDSNETEPLRRGHRMPGAVDNPGRRDHDAGMSNPNDLDPERTRVRLSAAQIAGLCAFVLTAGAWGFSVKSDIASVLTRLDGFGNSPGIDGRLTRTVTVVESHTDQLGALRTEFGEFKRDAVRRTADDVQSAETNRALAEMLRRIEAEYQKGGRR